MDAKPYTLEEVAAMAEKSTAVKWRAEHLERVRATVERAERLGEGVISLNLVLDDLARRLGVENEPKEPDVLADAVETLRQRAEYAESRLASISGKTRQELVEAAVRATIEACAERVGFQALGSARQDHRIKDIDPAPIVARVLGGEK